MNRNFIVFLCLLMFGFLEVNAQKTELNKITEENITFGIPNGWTVETATE